MRTIEFCTKTYDFLAVVKKWLGVESLQSLHHSQKYNHFFRETDQSTKWHEIFYREIRVDSSFDSIYMRFLGDVIKPKYGEEIVYQKIPTLRVHLPENVSVGEFHKDKCYRNTEWADKVQEMNYYLPLTKAYGTNTIWVESEEDKEDFSPIEAEWGECIEWDGSNLKHGNKENLTTETRVSVDFRIIPKSRYLETDNNLSINTKIPFAIGGYYEIM